MQNLRNKSVIKPVLVAALLLLLTGSCVAQQAAEANDNAAGNSVARTDAGYPVKTIKIMVPANPGGGWDQLGRLLQHVIVTEGLSPVPVEVINRGGAGGTIGLAELVSRHAADPYTIMISGSAMVGSVLAHGSPFDLNDTTPLARMASEFEVVAVPLDSPYQTLEQLMADFKADPSQVIWGGGSAGGVDHILVGLIAEQAGVDSSQVNYVAFGSGGEAGAAVMGGQITAGISGLAEWEGLAEANLLRFLGISAPERLAATTIPTLIESGVNVTLENWRSIMAAPQIKAEQYEWLIELLQRVHDSEAWKNILIQNRWEDSYLTGSEFGEFIDTNSELMSRILIRIGIGEGGEGYAAVGPFVFPLIIGIGLLITLLILFFERRRAQPEVSEEIPGPETSWKKFSIAAGVTFVYILALQPLGILLATPPFIVVQARLSGSRSLVRDVIVGVLLAVGIYLIFNKFLHVDI